MEQEEKMPEFLTPTWPSPMGWPEKAGQGSAEPGAIKDDTMTTLHTELYDALISAGADASKARTAAIGLPLNEQMATKADLAVLETCLTWHMVGVGALIVAAVAVLQRWPA